MKMMFGRAVALASLATGLLVSGVFAAETPDNQGQAHSAAGQAQAAEHRQNNKTGQAQAAEHGQNNTQAQNEHAVGTSDECVRVHVAGRSGRIQIIGGGVHLVVLAENEDDRETNDLNALADKVANAVCGDAAASKEETDAVSAADNLQGIEVVHSNTYGGDDDKD